MPGVDHSYSEKDHQRKGLSDSGSLSARNVGAIDIGTNSIHLLVASVDPVLHTFSIDLAEKSTTRLGERNSITGELTAAAIERAFETLKRFKELALSYKVDQLLIAATSAVREAPNGQNFLDNIKIELDLDVELVSGIEEARLIYLGVLSGMPFGDREHFLLDIGGGSTELVLADGHDAIALTSTKVGAVRLQREFIKNDPISKSECEFLKAFIQGSMEPAVEKVLSRTKAGEIPSLVVTSGTAMAIGGLVFNEEVNRPIKLHGSRLSKDCLSEKVERLLRMNYEERRRLSSVSDRRAEIIIPGALILHTTMQMLGAEELLFSERALREGLICDWMLRKGFLKDRFAFQSSIRRRTVFHQVQRFGVNRLRAERVARDALIFYDSTRGYLHHDQGEGRELLWAAAMLHSCGQQINSSSYHKHSWYLIRHGDLLGYTQAEHLMVAAIARYHRRSLPRKRHEAWQVLEKGKQRETVFEMALLLRLAASLDRRPQSVIELIKVQCNSSEMLINLMPRNDNESLELETWSLMKCAPIILEQKGMVIKTIEEIFELGS